MAINPKKYIDQLILALEQKGYFYDYQSKRFFSAKTRRYCTKYSIVSKEDKTNKCESYNKIEILKFLVREFNRKVKGEIPGEYTVLLEDEE